MNKDAVVIGHGFVGKATMKTFGIKDYITRHEQTIILEEAKKRKFIFICLPTPTVNGKVFTDDITQVIRDFANPTSIFVMRSTVPVGFADDLRKEYKVNIVSNPEFLSEDTWEKDAINPKLIVLGGSGDSLEAVKGLYQGRFKYCKPVVTNNCTAEMIKYALNTWFATKVVFSNEMFDACQLLKANYETVKASIEAHPWGMQNHNVIFYKGKRGLHGHCLPKDTEAFATQTGSELLKVVSKLKYE